MIGLLLVLLWVVLLARLVRRRAEAGTDMGGLPRGPRERQPRARQARPGRQLPEGHRPPAGLGPISPSERFLTTEAERGLRDLQRWLAGQQPA